MIENKSTKRGLKKVSAFLDPKEHAQMKAAAAIAGVFQEEWMATAIREKLEREKRKQLSVVHGEE
jgi:hypothetical protein